MNKIHCCYTFNCDKTAIYGYFLGCSIFCKEHAFQDMMIVGRECCISNDIPFIADININYI